MIDNRYLRSRISVIDYMIYENSDDNNKRLFQNGFIPDCLREEFEMRVNQYMSDDSSDLSFTELATYNTWYTLHPEKVAGIMVENKSLMFPIKVVGEKEDVLKMFGMHDILSDNEEIEILELEAEALMLILKLK